MENILEILDMENKFELFIQDYKRENFDVIIYGSGKGASFAISLLRKNNIEVVYIVDSDCQKHGKDYRGIPIISLEELILKYPNRRFKILIAAPQYEEEIRLYVSKYIEPEFIYSFECELYINFIPSIEKYRKYLKNNKERTLTLYVKLEDEVSKKTLFNILKGRITGELSYFREIYVPNQYFIKEIIQLNDNEVFLDIGASYGDTLIDIVNNTGNLFKKIYCFEPDKRCLEVLKKTKEELNLHNVVIIGKGAWDKAETLKFLVDPNLGLSKIIDEIPKQENDIFYEIETTCVDDMIDEEVTFIKIDIEGAEQRALKGLNRTIKMYKPKLAICVYHKIEDLLNISEVVVNINPNYKIYLRHHGIIGTDTVLYAIDR